MDYLVGYMSYISFYVTKFLFIEGRKQYILQRMASKQLSVIFILTRQGKIALQNCHGRRMERSTGQQLKMIPLCDQQPFLLQLGKLHRHGGTLHAEKICQLLTVKGDVKGEGGLPDGFGRQVGQ